MQTMGFIQHERNCKSDSLTDLSPRVAERKISNREQNTTKTKGGSTVGENTRVNIRTRSKGEDTELQTNICMVVWIINSVMEMMLCLW